jgi:pimeloyl-ACP methyl ester carboxylesterase
VESTATLRLRDGRLLEYACYGDVGGLPALFFHGFIGSHHQAAFAADAARRGGVRLIAPNRPGVGRSTPKRRRQLNECVPDMQELADALGLERFAVIGVSGGAPYALACLASLGERVPLAVLVSGLGPVGDPGVLAKMGPLARKALGLSRRMPWLLRWLFRIRLGRFRNDPDAFLARLAVRWPRADRQLFTRPEVRQFFLGDLKEVLVNGQGAEGMVEELRMYQHWGFGLEDVPPTARVFLYHGRDDVLVPPGMSAHAASRLSGAEVTVHPGGHFMILDHADEVVQRVRERLLAEGRPILPGPPAGAP